MQMENEQIRRSWHKLVKFSFVSWHSMPWMLGTFKYRIFLNYKLYLICKFWKFFCQTVVSAVTTETAILHVCLVCPMNDCNVDSTAELGRRRRKIYGCRKSAEKNAVGHNPAVKKYSTAARFLSGGWIWHCKIQYKSTCLQLQQETRRSQAARNGIGIRPEPVNRNPSFVVSA